MHSLTSRCLFALQVLNAEEGKRWMRDVVIRKEHGEQPLDFGASVDNANSKELSVMSGEKQEKAHTNSKSVTSGIDTFKRNNDSKKRAATIPCGDLMTSRPISEKIRATWKRVIPSAIWATLSPSSRLQVAIFLNSYLIFSFLFVQLLTCWSIWLQ